MKKNKKMKLYIKIILRSLRRYRTELMFFAITFISLNLYFKIIGSYRLLDRQGVISWSELKSEMPNLLLISVVITFIAIITKSFNKKN
jgi:hypothetical protein